MEAAGAKIPPAPLAKIIPGRPAPTFGTGTALD